MKAAKWRDLADDEVMQKIRELSEEVFNLRFQLSMGVAKNPSRLGQARRDLARAYTVLHEKGAAAPAIAAPTRTAEPEAPKAPRARKARPARAAKAAAKKPAAKKPTAKKPAAKKKG